MTYKLDTSKVEETEIKTGPGARFKTLRTLIPGIEVFVVEIDKSLTGVRWASIEIADPQYDTRGFNGWVKFAHLVEVPN